MSILRRLAAVSICLVFLSHSGAAAASEPKQAFSSNAFSAISIGQIQDQQASKKIQKLLSDHPGAATALTSRQKSEIRAFVKKAKGKEGLVCTGLSLTRQRESMYRVVRLRAELVCEYANSLDSSLTTAIREKATKKRNENGRVTVSSQ